MEWATKDMTAKAWKELGDSEGKDTLDAKITVGLSAIESGEILRRITNAEEDLIKEEGKILTGRQRAWESSSVSSPIAGGQDYMERWVTFDAILPPFVVRPRLCP